jgi:16S rRNA (cytidine1402-2'-O)-methyltransferase
MSTAKPGTLYIVSTPIGNLKDITLRALDVLREVDFVACEDTRVTLKLLNRYEIKKPLISYHSKSAASVQTRLSRLLLEGKNIALVSDSGTPVISDPGSTLIRHSIDMGIHTVPIPGPSSVHTVLTASGISLSEYTFIGFLSSKASRRKKALSELKKHKTVFVFFESPHRIIAFLEDVLDSLGPVRGCVGKEMTKKFERFYRGDIAEILRRMRENGVKGEYTVIIDNRENMGYK